MDFFDNEINKRAIKGYLPNCKLYPVFSNNTTNNQTEIIEKGLGVFRETSCVFSLIVRSVYINIKEINKQYDLSYKGEFNQYIFLSGNDYLINNANTFLELSNRNPVVTDLDKTLWYIAFSYYLAITHSKQNMETNNMMMYTLCYLLNYVQEKEVETGFSINMESITEETPLFDHIINWDAKSPLFSRLCQQEFQKLNELSLAKKNYSDRVRSEQKEAEKIASMTNKNWDTFIHIVNELAEAEKEVIDIIVSSESSKAKINAINEYNRMIIRISKGYYIQNNQEFSLPEIFNDAYNRVLNANQFSRAKTETGSPFIVSPVLLSIVKNCNTANRVFISYHEFRLTPNKASAKKFLTITMNHISSNFGGEETQCVSFDQMVTDIYSKIVDFYYKNKNVIKNLSYAAIQKDYLDVMGIVSTVEETDSISKQLSTKIDEIQNSESNFDEFWRIIENPTAYRTPQKIEAEISETELGIRINEEKAIAQKIIFTLNIIYLFCDALRIMLTNRHANIKFKNPDVIKKYRSELFKIDNCIVQQVYGNLNDGEANISEYREDKGFDTRTLAEIENQEQTLIYSTFHKILFSEITELLDCVETKDIEGILRIKSQIKESINRFPSNVINEEYILQLDSISNRLCNVLIENCQSADDFIQLQMNIKNKLGNFSSNLPDSAIASLTTAEMLYNRYATTEYARNGFDYSCISALYYQAFEDAYNELIWSEYAFMLNNLFIGERKFTDILYQNQKSNISIREAKGYLFDRDSKQRKHYVKYSSNTIQVMETCMYKSFGILLQTIDDIEENRHFWDYFAHKAGFLTIIEMSEDNFFMDKCRHFGNSVSQSATMRNNASHGGSAVNIEQCSLDKKTVLNNLEVVRNDSIGLIQQLLYLLYAYK